MKYYMPFRLLKIIMVKNKKTKGALNPQGDWLLIFPNRILIILESKIKITGNDHQFRKLLIVKQIILAEEMRREQCAEYEYQCESVKG